MRPRQFAFVPRTAVLAVVTLLLSAACPAPPPVPLECTDGQVLSADGGACVAPLPPTTCAPGTRPTASSLACEPVGWTACDAGFQTDPTGFGCVDVTPAAPCAPGTMPVLGRTTCQPVGWTSCPTGFEPHASGWGCRDVSPAALCAGATRDALGQTTCAPLGDCAAAFPPAAASLFVDDSFTAGQLDAAHFKTIQAALDAAPAGATIAVEAGAYAESLTTPRAVNVVGRCAAQVQIAGSGTSAGLTVGVPGVDVRGVTLSVHLPGALVTGGGSLTLTEVLLSNNKRAGVVVTGRSGATPSTLTMTRSVARGTQVDGASTAAGVLVLAGGLATVSDSSLSKNASAGAKASGTGSTVKLTRTILADDGATSDSVSGGLVADGGGRLELTESVISGSRMSGVLARGGATRVVATRSVFRDSVGPTQYAVGFFVDGATVEADSVALWDHDGVGALGLGAPSALTFKHCVLALSAGRGASGGGFELDDDATLQAEDTAVINIGRASLYAVGPARATVTSSLFLGTREGRDASGYLAYGVLGNDGPTISLDRVAVVGAQVHGVSFSGPTTRGTITHSLIQGTRAGTAGATPVGLLVDDRAILTLSDSLVADNASFGIAMGSVVPGAAPTSGSGTITRTVVRDTRWDPAWPDAAGLMVQLGSFVSVTETSFSRNALAGVAAWEQGATVELDRVVIQDSVGTGDEFAYGVLAGNRALAFLTNSVVRSISGVGVLTHHQAGATIDRSLLEALPTGLKARDVRAGFGVVSVQANATVTASTIQGAGLAAIALEESQGTLRGSLVRANATALQVQGGTTLRQSTSPGDVPAALELLVTGDTVFDANTTLTGTGVVPLPAAPTF